jgi:hypothetical protein
MEEEFLSMWKMSPVWCTLDDPFAVSTVVESCLIKERALSIYSTGVELCVPSTIAFVVCVPTCLNKPNKTCFLCCTTVTCAGWLLFFSES